MMMGRLSPGLADMTWFLGLGGRASLLELGEIHDAILLYFVGFTRALARKPSSALWAACTNAA